MPICFILLTAYTFHLNSDISGWMAFGSFILCSMAINTYFSLNADEESEESKEPDEFGKLTKYINK